MWFCCLSRNAGNRRENVSKKFGKFFGEACSSKISVDSTEALLPAQVRAGSQIVIELSLSDRLVRRLNFQLRDADDVASIEINRGFECTSSACAGINSRAAGDRFDAFDEGRVTVIVRDRAGELCHQCALAASDGDAARHDHFIAVHARCEVFVTRSLVADGAGESSRAVDRVVAGEVLIKTNEKELVVVGRTTPIKAWIVARFGAGKAKRETGDC